MEKLPKAAIIMKVGPHSDMSLLEIIRSKEEEEKIHGVHYWGYSGCLCQPKPTQAFCKWAKEETGENPSIILIETKSSYKSSIGFITQFSLDNKTYNSFKAPVQLQGAQYSYVARNLRELDSFCPSHYVVYGGKNSGKLLPEHLRFRVNKSFATLKKDVNNKDDSEQMRVLIATLVEPYAIWLKE